MYNNTNLTAVSNNIELKYQDTILLTDPKGNPISGLDAAADGPYVQYKSLPGDPVLPSTNFTGDGFGGPGNGGTRVVGDNEGLVVAEDGTFWISDEYGPYIYQYGRKFLNSEIGLASGVSLTFFFHDRGWKNEAGSNATSRIHPHAQRQHQLLCRQPYLLLVSFRP